MLKPRFQYKPKTWVKLTCGACFLVVISLYNGINNIDPQKEKHVAPIDEFTPIQQNEHLPASRRLLFTLPNCTPPAIEQFPRTYFTREQRVQGAVVLHIIASLYVFLGLAIACDEYFVPALEVLCEVLKIKPDVAGATFMAAGSSAPELATAVIGVFVTEDDIGLGSVVGSAVFNIMLVISVCALFAGTMVQLSWWPLFRDCTFYAISIGALVLVIYDEKVHWYEAGAMLFLYVCYIVIMYLNSGIDEWITPKFTCCRPKINDEQTELVTYNNAIGTDTEEEEFSASHSLLPTANGNHKQMMHNGTARSSCTSAVHEQQICTNVRREEDPDSGIEVEVDVKEPQRGCLTPPEGCFKRFLWAISLPLTVAMAVTTPDCRKKKWRRWFFITFLMSCVWISLYSYIMIWMITIVGFTFHVPDTIMGLTFIAAGVSVPDAIASLLVVRDGYGDMAVSNAVGSNVFDILVCLGLPWFLKTLVVTPHSPVIVYSAGLVYSSLTLLSTVVFLLLATHLNGWKLDKKYGVVLLITYFLFMILATLYELNVFGYVHPPECPSSL